MKLTSSEGIGNKDEENHACDDLDQSVDTGSEQTGVAACYAQSNEDLRRVVVDGVTFEIVSQPPRNNKEGGKLTFQSSVG